MVIVLSGITVYLSFDKAVRHCIYLSEVAWSNIFDLQQRVGIYSKTALYAVVDPFLKFIQQQITYVCTVNATVYIKRNSSM